MEILYWTALAAGVGISAAGGLFLWYLERRLRAGRRDPAGDIYTLW